MIYKRALIAVSALATAMAWSIPSVAYEQGDWIIRAGAANVDPDTSSDKIDTEATIGTDLGDVKFDVKLDPWVYMVGISYRF